MASRAGARWTSSPASRKSCRARTTALIFLPRFINAFMSLKVESYVDLGSHGMFICSVEEARVMSERETMTYAYYQSNVKPKPQTEGKKGFVCKVCGYIYEGRHVAGRLCLPAMQTRRGRF